MNRINNLLLWNVKYVWDQKIEIGIWTIPRTENLLKLLVLISNLFFITASNLFVSIVYFCSSKFLSKQLES